MGEDEQQDAAAMQEELREAFRLYDKEGAYRTLLDNIGITVVAFMKLNNDLLQVKSRTDPERKQKGL